VWREMVVGVDGYFAIIEAADGWHRLSSCSRT
jgi:hypothetical protein